MKFLHGLGVTKGSIDFGGDRDPERDPDLGFPSPDQNPYPENFYCSAQLTNLSVKYISSFTCRLNDKEIIYVYVPINLSENGALRDKCVYFDC